MAEKQQEQTKKGYSSNRMEISAFEKKHEIQ
jgi:hypothetical protein